MDDKNQLVGRRNLCKDCENRFRRVFIPHSPEDYIDADGNKVLDEGDNIVIVNLCLLSDIDLDMDLTVECTHYKSIHKETQNDDTIMTLFKNPI